MKRIIIIALCISGGLRAADLPQNSCSSNSFFVPVNILEEIEGFTGESKKATGPIFFNSHLQDLPTQEKENNLARLMGGFSDVEHAIQYVKEDMKREIAAIARVPYINRLKYNHNDMCASEQLQK